MQGQVVELARDGLLHQATEVHHADPVADVAHHGEVVRHHEVGQAELVLEVLEQVDHLRLDRDVEGTHRLVGDDQVGVDREGARDADALSLAARELVGVLA